MENKTSPITLENLGYDAFFETSRKALGLDGHAVARISAEYKNAYRIIGPHGEYLARITGKQIYSAQKRADYPAVGDWVAITVLDPENAVIHNTLPRKTVLSKRYSDKQDAQVMAANVDVAFIVEAVDRDFNLNRLERYMVLVRQGKIRPVIILNKIDLVSEDEVVFKIKQIEDRCRNGEVVSTSMVTEKGLDKLTGCIEKGQTYCFLGSSGVGKSSLINKLFGKDIARTQEISQHTGRGKHVTTSRELYVLGNGGLLIDNPGTRAVGMEDSGGGIEHVFDEISLLAQQCKYADCTHSQEPGCAVLDALQSDKLDEKKYQNYIKLKKEAAHYAMSDLEKRRKDRQFGRFVKKSLKQLEEFGS